VSKGVIPSDARFLSFIGFFVLSFHFLFTFYYNFFRTRSFTSDVTGRRTFVLFQIPFSSDRLSLVFNIRHDFFSVKQGHNSEPPLSFWRQGLFCPFSQAAVYEGNWDEAGREDGR
jgi:hypothetical protein